MGEKNVQESICMLQLQKHDMSENSQKYMVFKFYIAGIVDLCFVEKQVSSKIES
jgi:hypothetical protein